MIYKDWIETEYKLWVEALQESTVHNFKEHPQVKRMLGEIDGKIFEDSIYPIDTTGIIQTIDNIGYANKVQTTGNCLRMIYYATKIAYQTSKDLNSICEIGAGVGEFFAILRALGYRGEYYIYDLPEVKTFQRLYLDEVTKQTGLNTDLLPYPKFDFCCSFYALGEFEDWTKQWYINNVVKKCKHGLIIFNPHSGASEEINFECAITDEYPRSSDAVLAKQLVW